MCAARGVPAARIGVVDSEADGLQVQDQFAVPTADLSAASEGTFPSLFD